MDRFTFLDNFYGNAYLWKKQQPENTVYLYFISFFILIGWKSSIVPK